MYARGEREKWLERLPEAMRPLAEMLYEELDVLTGTDSPARAGRSGTRASDVQGERSDPGEDFQRGRTE